MKLGLLYASLVGVDRLVPFVDEEEDELDGEQDQLGLDQVVLEGQPMLSQHEHPDLDGQ